MKNSWGGEKYYFVSYSFMKSALRGGVVILDVVDPEVGKPVSLARGGAWLGIWPVHHDAKSDLDGTIVIRRTFDPNVAVQPKAGTDIPLGDYYPSDNSPALPVNGHMAADSKIMFEVKSPKATTPTSYAWNFGAMPEKTAAK
jgi:hypothetical protein